MLPYNDLHLNCLRWGDWHRTRRFYAPLPPKNLLCRMRTPAGMGDLPDAELCADLSLFNKAVAGIPASDAKTAFLCAYLYRIRTRDLVDYFNAPRRTVWSRIETVRETAYLVYVELLAHRYADQAVTSLDARRKLRKAGAHTAETRYSATPPKVVHFSVNL